MKNKLLFILTNPLFISIILTVAVLIFLPPTFPKYKVDLIKKEKSKIIEFSDLNNDGYSEEITIIKNFENRTGIIVRDKGVVVDQWSFKGNFNMNELFCGDFNNDGLKDIFLITISKNKILLNCFNPYENKRYIIDKYIDDFYPKNGETKCSLQYINLIDINNDKMKEILFVFSTGYSIHPRKVYLYNFAKDTLYKSPESCTSFSRITTLKTQSNKAPLFVVSTAAVGNCDSNTIFSDYFTWLMVFNKNLNFKFEPKKINVYPAFLSIEPIRVNNKLYLAALNIYYGVNNRPCTMALYDLNGKIIKEKKLKYKSDLEYTILTSTNNFDNLYLLKKNGSIEVVDTNLNTKQIQQISPFHPEQVREIDIDLDNQNEFIFNHRDLNKTTILRSNFADPVIVDVTENTGLSYCSTILNGKNKSLLFLRYKKYSYYYNYYKNPLYNFRFLFYSLIYLGIFGFIFALQKAQKYRLEYKFKAEKKIAELQIKSIKNQTDPHFTLNIINSIGSLVAKQETEKANYIFGKYSKLLRSTILSSDQIVTTLDDELEYVENYLSLEQFRLKNDLHFEIKKDDDIDGNIKIPKMLIHTFVENSIKHGIKHLDGDGKIVVSVTNENDLYKIKITDNGIGRKKANEIKTFGTGKGLEIMNQILDLYYTLEKVKVTYEIIDLTDKNNEPVGTEVLINIPLLNLK